MSNQTHTPEQYSAASLEDIARMFDELADRERTASFSEYTIKGGLAREAAAAAYRDCARILRETKLI